MALQIRRGLESQRAGITPVAGELLYTTDEKLVYIGDGATAGGILLAGGGGSSDVVSDTSPQLGGELDVNGFRISSINNGNVSIHPDGTGLIYLHGNLNIDNNGNISKTGGITFLSSTLTTFGSNETLNDGNVRIVRNTHSTATSQGLSFEQHHSVADAVNCNFVRTRGTGLSPLAVVSGDELSDLSFVGHDGTNRVTAAVLTTRVAGPVSLGVVPGEFSFTTRNLSGAFGERATLSSEGVWKVNSIENYSGADLTLTATNVKIAGDVQINAQGDLKFADANSSNYVAFQAPDTVVSNVTWTLPAADGTNGQVLSTSGTGVLSWSTPASQSVTTSRTALPSLTTSLLTPDASDALEITGYKGYILYTVQTSDSAWVRLYSSTAARDADAIRAEGMDPVPGSGVIAEVTTAGAATILITPGVIGFSTELPPTTSIPCSIKNKSATTTAITVTLTVLQLEV